MPPWSGGAGATFAYNCWGWALGNDCWIDKPEYIYEDNYEPVNRYPQSPGVIPVLLMGRVRNGIEDTHVVKIGAFLSDIGPYGPGMIPYSFYLPASRSEKMRDSGIYTLSVNTGPLGIPSGAGLYQPK